MQLYAHKRAMLIYAYLCCIGFMLLYESRDPMQRYAIQELMLCYAVHIYMQVYVFQCICLQLDITRTTSGEAGIRQG